MPVTWDVVFYDNGHQVPSKVARPPLSTMRTMALRTLSFHDDRLMTWLMIPILSADCSDDGWKSSDRHLSSITSTRYLLLNCLRGTLVDGRRSWYVHLVTRTPPFAAPLLDESGIVFSIPIRPCRFSTHCHAALARPEEALTFWNPRPRRHGLYM